MILDTIFKARIVTDQREAINSSATMSSSHTRNVSTLIKNILITTNNNETSMLSITTNQETTARGVTKEVLRINNLRLSRKSIALRALTKKCTYQKTVQISTRLKATWIQLLNNIMRHIRSHKMI